MTKHWIFIIDTEQYSGNFEREMTAYLTGRTGDCGIGEEFAELFRKDAKGKKSTPDFDELVTSNIGDHGCSRPCEIQPTPGWYNNGLGGHFRTKKGDTTPRFPAYLSVGIFFQKRPSDKVIAYLKERSAGFHKATVALHATRAHNPYPAITITGFRLVHVEEIQTEEVV